MTTMTTYEPAGWRPEPGDVAMVTYDGSESVRVMDRQRRWWGSTNGFLWTENLKRARRLQVVDPASTVVLDPDNPDDVERLAEAIKANPIGAWPSVADAALRSLLPVVTPPEPNGLGAVVEIRDDSGQDGTAVFTGCEWTARFPHFVDYQAAFYDLDVTKVLSHGVGCSCGAPDCPGGAVTRPYCLRCEVPIYRDEEGIWRREGTGSQVCPRNPAVDGHEPRPDCNGGAQ